jgi:hypothetical protein
MSDQLPEAAFDLVHARLVLMFLSPRLGALQRLVKAARPGGWVASIAPDFTTVLLTPTTLVWQRVWSLLLDAAMAGGWDPGYGARLCSDLRAAGLVDVHAEQIARSYPGGSLPSRLLSLTVERLREQMILLGADSDEIDEAQRLLQDPANTLTSPMTCVARGRRPPLEDLSPGGLDPRRPSSSTLERLAGSWIPRTGEARSRASNRGPGTVCRPSCSNSVNASRTMSRASTRSSASPRDRSSSLASLDEYPRSCSRHR